MSKGPYSAVTPCKLCPFRNDIRAYLNADRVREIEVSFNRAEFPCHETTTHDDEGDAVESGEEVHCAGALILLEKLERPSQMMRISERVGLYDRTKLNMEAPVFDSFDEMADAQPERCHRQARRRASK